MSTLLESVKRIAADRRLDGEGQPKAFVLRNGSEQLVLEPGKAWHQLDSFKWVTRGVIEEPHGFHVLASGAVELHSEIIELNDPDALAKLEEGINRRYAPAAPKHPPHMAKPPAPEPHSNRVKFKVRLDKMGHFMVACVRSGEKVETGIRGLEGWVKNGLMLKPKGIHLDPLLRYVEIDSVRFDSDNAGAAALENRLNALYAPTLKGDGHAAVEIKENHAAASGFDIHFYTFRAGARFEVKGHLSQEQLDVLQDSAKCQLLRPGIVLRLSPPHLIIRRRRSDGVEEKIPELPDVHYLRVTAAELQRILNHPVLRRGGDATPQEVIEAEQGIHEVLEFHILRNPHNKAFLNLEMLTPHGPRTKAFTHHNVAELRQAGIFYSHFDLVLAVDNRTLSILNTDTRQEERIEVDHDRSDEDLLKASQMLTRALKPIAPATPKPAPAAVVESEIAPTPVPPLPEPRAAPPIISQPPIATKAPPAAEIKAPPRIEKAAEPKPAPTPEPEINPEIRALFSETNPVRIHREIFQRLGSCLAQPVLGVQLSLEMVFQNRLFEIISFTHENVSDVLELRSRDFAGFYLSHISEQKNVFTYAHHGKRLEWGMRRCVVQSGATPDPEEFSGGALLGMALPESNRFVFVVTSEFRQWIKKREALFVEVGATFASVEDVANNPEKYPLVWPVP